MASPGAYHRLKHYDEIRLRKVLRAHSLDEPVDCGFAHCRLPDKPHYEARSYTWGDTTIVQPVSIKPAGVTVTVTQNCYNLLQSLRKPDESRTLWVDAVCINQADLDERAQQVRIMGHIYASA